MGSARDVVELSRAFLGGNRGYVAVWKVVIDESGVHDGSPVVTVGAYVGRPRQWEAFVPEWRAAIRPAKVYHATDAAACRGEFDGWSKDEVAAVAAKALPAIARHTEFAVAGGINLRDYEAALEGKPKLRAMFGSPYAACLQWVLTTILEWKQANAPREMISFVHEDTNFRREALDVFDHIKRNWNADRAKITTGFADKSGYVPLQAADVLAYEVNKRLRDVAKPTRRAFQALQPQSGRMTICSYDRTNIGYLVEGLEEVRFRDLSGAAGLA